MAGEQAGAATQGCTCGECLPVSLRGWQRPALLFSDKVGKIALSGTALLFAFQFHAFCLGWLLRSLKVNSS